MEAKPSEVDQEGYPTSMVAVVDLPARGELPPVKLTLYAKDKPSEELLLGSSARRLGRSARGIQRVDLLRLPVEHPVRPVAEGTISKHQSRPAADACRRPTATTANGSRPAKATARPSPDFEIGGPLTELMQLVNLATLVEGPIEYDTLSGKVLNSKPASALIHRPYRKGWSL